MVTITVSVGMRVEDPQKAQLFFSISFWSFIWLPFPPSFLEIKLMDGDSSRTRLWAHEWVGLRSHQGICRWTFEGKEVDNIYGYPRLALVKTLSFCQCDVVALIGQSVTWTAGLSLVLSCT